MEKLSDGYKIFYVCSGVASAVVVVVIINVKPTAAATMDLNCTPIYQTSVAKH